MKIKIPSLQIDPFIYKSNACDKIVIPDEIFPTCKYSRQVSINFQKNPSDSRIDFSKLGFSSL